jgi:arylsulfatase A-like enzyme
VIIGRKARALACASFLLALLLLGAALDSPPRAPAAESRPNVIVVMTDDQRVSQLQPGAMPATLNELATNGTTFAHSFVSSPLCCPSRAGLLTGTYAHNNGVFDNTPGYPALNQKSSTLHAWLDAAGYRTGHVGRFLLGYPDEPGTQGGAAPPPGVDDWYGYIDQATHYYNARFSDNGTPVEAGIDTPQAYTTEVINQEARRFVASAAPSDTPFFLWVAHLAPHTTNAPLLDGCGDGTPLPEPGAYAGFASHRLPRPPSFDERRITDKPRWVRSKPRIGRARLALLRHGWRCALASLTTVDRGVAELVAELRARGELDRTAIFFTSDNGLYFGEHRAVQDKGFPYDEAIRVPLLARVPASYLGSQPPSRIDLPVTNLDLTATILDLAGARPCTPSVCRTLDGRSLAPLLQRNSSAWPTSRGVLVELGNRNCARDPSAANGLNVFYDGIRTPRFLYVELHRVDRRTGLCKRREWELYNLRRDPHQLENLAANPERERPSAVQRGLAARLAALRTCAGVAGRDVPPPGRRSCE